MAATFFAASGAGWTMIVDGAEYSRVGVQHAGEPVKIFVGEAVPADNAEAYVRLGRDISHEVVVGLLPAEKLYIRTDAPMAVAVRGFREVRA